MCKEIAVSCLLELPSPPCVTIQNSSITACLEYIIMLKFKFDSYFHTIASREAGFPPHFYRHILPLLQHSTVSALITSS